MKAIITLALVGLLAVPAIAQQTGWIGVTVEDGKDQGALIRSVETDSPASKAGLKSNDLIIEYNKTSVLGSVQLTRLIRETPAGRTVDIKVKRDNRDQTMQITPSRVQDGMTQIVRNGRLLNGDMSVFMDNLRRDVPRVSIVTSLGRSGIQVNSMTEQLRTYFGVSGSDGVLVASVTASSLGAKAGIKAGDVITAVDNQAVRTPSDFEREMRRAGDKASVHVIRDKKGQDITIDRAATK